MDKEIKGIICKPQFDTAVYTIGKHVKIRLENGTFDGFEYHRETDCLVKSCTPLKLSVVYVQEEDEDNEYNCEYEKYNNIERHGCIYESTIDIKQIVNGQLSISADGEF